MGRTTVAVRRSDEQTLVTGELSPGEGQAEHLVPLVGEIMKQSRLDFKSLDRVAVCVGPGGFSAIRSGVAAARGIALAARIPVVGVTSFRIMAAFILKSDGPPSAFGLVAAAGTGAYFGQIVGRGGDAISEIRLLAAGDLADFFAKRAGFLAGPAPGEALSAGNFNIAFDSVTPNAALLVELAPNLDPAYDLAVPAYVRPADARPQDRHVIARRDL